MNVHEHEGKKYLRKIWPADGNGEPILVDVYSVLVAFGVTCPARAHAIKKLLCAGHREKGDEMDDLKGAAAAVARAVELQEIQDICNWEEAGRKAKQIADNEKERQLIEKLKEYREKSEQTPDPNTKIGESIRCVLEDDGYA